jgi:Animal haem peroxidase
MTTQSAISDQAASNGDRQGPDAAPRPLGRHGVAPRGLSLGGSTGPITGRYSRIFPSLPAADWGADDDASQSALMALGAKMMSTLDEPKDGPDDEESGLPAAYTYFGQFIDHDLTFDPVSLLARQDDPNALIDFRTPRFDLDNVYGRGPDDQPYLYLDSRRLLQGAPLTGNALGTALTARDLPRSAATSIDPTAENRAIIGDPRNDENVIVSQLQGLMLQLHNRIATENPTWSFPQVQQEVRFHYQWVVLHDFLPSIVSTDVIASVLPFIGGSGNPVLEPIELRFYDPGDGVFMPLEFSVAAYRFGHSMIRPGYRLNDEIGPLPIFPFKNRPNDPALTGFGQFPSQWAIDWGRFIDLDTRPYGNLDRAGEAGSPGNLTRTQLAYKIDTSLVDPLKDLPARVAGDPPPGLAARNLLRGWRLRLPSGQDVARAMGLDPISDVEIGKFTGSDPTININTIHGGVFTDTCPLWTYVLAETTETTVDVTTSDGVKSISTRTLGPVGGRIVAETFAGIMDSDDRSYLNVNPLWKPNPALATANGTFGIRELVAAAMGSAP